MRPLQVNTIVGIALLGLYAGCDAEGPPTFPVSGHISVAGQPLSSGEIIFRDPSGSSDAGKVVDGKYAFATTPGNKRVEITASGTAGQASATGSGEPEIQLAALIPPKYNLSSELTVTVTPDGENAFEFELTP